MSSLEKSPKILIVDDSKENLKILHEYFTGLEYDILFCNESREVEAIVLEEQPNLILLDILMPEMSGFEVCELLKCNEHTRDIPVIFMTALSDMQSKIQAFESGGIDYITKPFELNEVRLRVSNQLRLLEVQKELRESYDQMESKVELRTQELQSEIQERKKSEIALEEANKKLMDNQSRLVQSEKLAGIGQLAAGVAHEINNPVGYITSNLGTLQDYVGIFITAFTKYKEYMAAVKSGDTDAVSAIEQELSDLNETEDIDFILDDVGGLLTESIDGAAKVKDIVHNLKVFARADDDAMKSADINEGIESTLKVVWNELKYKCEVVKDYGELPMTMCHLGKLNQVFLNLLVNASHAIEKQGTITIKTWNADSSIFVSIKDTGSGIKPEDVEKLFDPFFTTKPVGVGTGLGLAISHGIIGEHNGSIQVNSKLGEGTEFIINLPVVGE